MKRLKTIFYYPYLISKADEQPKSPTRHHQVRERCDLELLFKILLAKVVIEKNKEIV